MFRLRKNENQRPSIVVGSALMFILLSLGPGCCNYFACQKSLSFDPTLVSEVPTYSMYVSPYFNTNKPRRIVLLASGRTPGNYDETQKLISLLAAKIRAAGAFEIIVPPDERLHLDFDDILKGRFEEREIAELSRRYNADAVGLIRVNDFRAYTPMRTSVTMAIVDSAETIVTFAVDGSWDTADPGVGRQFQRYVKDHSRGNPLSTQIPSLQLQSPDSLFGFVASQMDQALQSTFY